MKKYKIKNTLLYLTFGSIVFIQYSAILRVILAYLNNSLRVGYYFTCLAIFFLGYMLGCAVLDHVETKEDLYNPKHAQVIVKPKNFTVK